MSTQPEEEPLQLSRRTISTVFFLCSRALGSLFNKLNMFCQQVWDLPESDRFFPVYIYIYIYFQNVVSCGVEVLPNNF